MKTAAFKYLESMMTAKSAADALMKYDTDLRARVEALTSRGDLWWLEDGARDDQAAVLRECAGTWTLSLAAEAAGVTERQVLTALARLYLLCGTQVCSSSAVAEALRK